MPSFGGEAKKNTLYKGSPCHGMPPVVTICGDEGHKDVIRDRKQLLKGPGDFRIHFLMVLEVF